MVDVVLASGSNARLKVLKAAGISPRVIVSGIDESVYSTYPPRTLVLMLAEAKARKVAAELSSGYVIGCDSVFSFASDIDVCGLALGKPSNRQAAVALWEQLSGQEGYLLTGHYVMDIRNKSGVSEVNVTKMRFAEVDDIDIAAYVRTGEPLEGAGGFAIDRLGGWFVETIEGDYSNIVGISLPTLRRLFGQLGLNIAQLWGDDVYECGSTQN